MNNLTHYEQQVYDFIVAYYKEHRVPPTSIAIANHISKSGQRARQIIKTLVDKGFLQKTKRFGLYTLPVEN